LALPVAPSFSFALLWFGLVWFETEHERRNRYEQNYGGEQNAKGLTDRKKACWLISLEVLFRGFPFDALPFCFSSCSFVKNRVLEERERKSVSGEVGCHIGLQQQREPATAATTTTLSRNQSKVRTHLSCMSQNKKFCALLGEFAGMYSLIYAVEIALSRASLAPTGLYLFVWFLFFVFGFSVASW